ncbi:MAG: hypothetical protein JNL42_05540 [Anaerolineae bacterium]|nr:hypothetical protein [Anaerolineae bacterium]
MIRPASPESEGFSYRLRTVLLAIPAAMLAGALISAARGWVAAGSAANIEGDLTMGAAVCLIGGLILGAGYLFIARRWRWVLHWSTVLASAYLTLPLTALLYTALDLPALKWLVPAIADAAAPDLQRRALLGAVDGCLYGAALGALICLLDPAAVRFNRRGVLNFAFDYLILGLGMALLAYLNYVSAALDALSSALTILFLMLMKVMIAWRETRFQASAFAPTQPQSAR